MEENHKRMPNVPLLTQLVQWQIKSLPFKTRFLFKKHERPKFLHQITIPTILAQPVSLPSRYHLNHHDIEEDLWQVLNEELHQEVETFDQKNDSLVENLIN